MTQSEFLEKLKKALENDLSGQAVQENVNYYRAYIIEETGKGRTEEAVITELGDPWVIARSLIEVAENAGESRDGSAYYENTSRRKPANNANSERRSNIHVTGFRVWWKKLLLILGIIGAILILVAVIGGIFSLLMPLLVPILLVMLVVRLIGGTRR